MRKHTSRRPLALDQTPLMQHGVARFLTWAEVLFSLRQTRSAWRYLEPTHATDVLLNETTQKRWLAAEFAGCLYSLQCESGPTGFDGNFFPLTQSATCLRQVRVRVPTYFSNDLNAALTTCTQLRDVHVTYYDAEEPAFRDFEDEEEETPVSKPVISLAGLPRTLTSLSVELPGDYPLGSCQSCQELVDLPPSLRELRFKNSTFGCTVDILCKAIARLSFLATIELNSVQFSDRHDDDDHDDDDVRFPSCSLPSVTTVHLRGQPVISMDPFFLPGLKSVNIAGVKRRRLADYVNSNVEDLHVELNDAPYQIKRELRELKTITRFSMVFSGDRTIEEFCKFGLDLPSLESKVLHPAVHPAGRFHPEPTTKSSDGVIVVTFKR